MLYFTYDKTLEGLLTGIYDAFYRKEIPLKLISDTASIPLFTESHKITTDPAKAERVLNGLSGKISQSAIHMLYTCFQSESEDVENAIFRYICKAFRSEKSIELNFADEDVMELSKVYKKVTREEERMRQFIRFQKTADGIFFACVEPKYNVIPLTLGFFEDRFADQQWLIYDIKRACGWYYDRHKTEEVRFEQPLFDFTTGKLSNEILEDEEIDFQQLWRKYIQSISIKERMNLKLQRQHMPKRFWKFLTEKQ